MQEQSPLFSRFLLAVSSIGIVSGGAAWLAGDHAASQKLWAVGAMLVAAPVAYLFIKEISHGNWGIDLLGILAITAAIIVGENLAAAIIALMLSTGYYLEEYAKRRSRRELSELLKRAPRIAHRRTLSGWEEVDVDQLKQNDVVLVRAGDVVPADGVLLGEALLDQSSMTGESVPVNRSTGAEVPSGVVNAGEAFEVQILRPAKQSEYNQLVQLVRLAEEKQAPFVRLADRYARWFLPLSLLLAGVAWAWSGDPVRGVAVLVVATPCPLILAAPIALVAGISRAAQMGIIVKGGGVLEQLGVAGRVLIDKTGTLTLGTPRVEKVVASDGLPEKEILRLAASLDQFSSHVWAEALVGEAEYQGLAMERPSGVVEAPGQGISGLLPQGKVQVGSYHWFVSQGYDIDERVYGDSAARVLVGIDGKLVGAILLKDRLRPDAKEAVSRIRKLGIGRVIMITGDQSQIAQKIAVGAGVDQVYAEMKPEDKMNMVSKYQASQAKGSTVMVGDGINDAPALALADVGIAMGQQGAVVAAETADAVIATDKISRIADAIAIGQRTLRIAKQSVVAGVVLSVLGMAVAAIGYLPPVAGALFQETIDVGVILNALRALR